MGAVDGELRDLVFARLAEQDLAGAVAELVATPSENPPGGEDAMAAALAGLAGRWGLAAQVDPVAEGRSNVRVGAGDGPCDVLLAGHLDTVPADPAGWTEDPFAGRVVDGQVWGRGSVDMKGAAAAVAGGRPADPGGAAFFSDASVLQPALGGVPTILFGPGATERMHQVDEHVAVADLHTAARGYAALLIDRIPGPPDGRG